MKCCTFTGHRVIKSSRELSQKLKLALKELIENEEVDTFYLINNNDFDLFCSNILKQLQVFYPHIKLNLIICNANEVKETNYALYTNIISPPELRKINSRHAAYLCNKWMVNNSDFLIYYIEVKKGVEYLTTKYALNKNKKLIPVNSTI